MTSFSKSWILLIVFALVGCGGGSGGGGEAPDEGTYMGKVSEFNKEGKTMTVTLPDSAENADESPLSLSLTDSTEVLRNYMSMPLDSVKVDQDVRIKVVKSGDKVVPKQVMLLN